MLMSLGKRSRLFKKKRLSSFVAVGGGGPPATILLLARNDDDAVLLPELVYECPIVPTSVPTPRKTSDGH
jgi:hypothetical protein